MLNQESPGFSRGEQVNPPGTPVDLAGIPGEPDSDVYGRTLANAFTRPPAVDATGPINVSLWLVDQGQAVAYREYPTAETDEAIRLETQAREAGRGMWAMCTGGTG